MRLFQGKCNKVAVRHVKTCVLLAIMVHVRDGGLAKMSYMLLPKFRIAEFKRRRRRQRFVQIIKSDSCASCFNKVSKDNRIIGEYETRFN